MSNVVQMTATDLGCQQYTCQRGKGDPPMDCIYPDCPCPHLFYLEPPRGDWVDKIVATMKANADPLRGGIVDAILQSKDPRVAAVRRKCSFDQIRAITACAAGAVESMKDEAALASEQDADRAERATTPTEEAALRPMLEHLFKLVDDADQALDEDTYEQLRKDEFDPPNDADYSVRAGTTIKCNRVFNHIESIRNSLKGKPLPSDGWKS